MGSECPKCQKDDMVVKVSSIFSSGLSATTQSGPAIGVGLYGGKIGIGLGGSSSSGINVTQLSMRLKPPAQPKGTSCFVIGLVFLVGSFILVGVFGQMSDALAVIMIIACVAGLIAWVINSRKNQERKMAIYNRLMREWEVSYYCSRDDIVFNPSTGEFHTPESMQSDFNTAFES